MQGTSSIFNFLQANNLPCPAIIELSGAIKIGLVNPNSFMLDAIWVICSSLCVLLLLT